MLLLNSRTVKNSQEKIISKSDGKLAAELPTSSTFSSHQLSSRRPIAARTSVDNLTACVPARRGSTLDTAGAYARGRAPAGPHARRTSLAASPRRARGVVGTGRERWRAGMRARCTVAHARPAGRPMTRGRLGAAACRARARRRRPIPDSLPVAPATFARVPRVPAGALRPGPPCHRTPFPRAQRRRRERDAAGVATRAAHY